MFGVKNDNFNGNAHAGIVTKEIKSVAAKEGINADTVRKFLRRGLLSSRKMLTVNRFHRDRETDEDKDKRQCWNIEDYVDIDSEVEKP